MKPMRQPPDPLQLQVMNPDSAVKQDTSCHTKQVTEMLLADLGSPSADGGSAQESRNMHIRIASRCEGRTRS